MSDTEPPDKTPAMTNWRECLLRHESLERRLAADLFSHSRFNHLSWRGLFITARGSGDEISTCGCYSLVQMAQGSTASRRHRGERPIRRLPLADTSEPCPRLTRSEKQLVSSPPSDNLTPWPLNSGCCWESLCIQAVPAQARLTLSRQQSLAWRLSPTSAALYQLSDRLGPTDCRMSRSFSVTASQSLSVGAGVAGWSSM